MQDSKSGRCQAARLDVMLDTGSGTVLHAREPGVAGVEGKEGGSDVQSAQAAGVPLAGRGGGRRPGAGSFTAPAWRCGRPGDYHPA